MKKVISIILKSALVIVYAASFAGYMMIRPQLSTLCSVEKLNDHPFYQMNYSGDYYFDEYLKHGGATIEDTMNFVAEQMGIEKPFESNGSGFGCSTIYSPTTDGDYIFARNFDYPSASALLIHTAPDDGYESVSMVNLEHMGYGSENPYHYDFADSWSTDTAIIAADAVFCAAGVLIIACFIFGFIRRKNKAKKSAE